VSIPKDMTRSNMLATAISLTINIRSMASASPRSRRFSLAGSRARHCPETDSLARFEEVVPPVPETGQFPGRARDRLVP
jgi:hypothetical protein